MDTKNVIAAISLSAAVIVLYTLFFQPDPTTIKKNSAEQEKIENNADTPSLDKNENFTKISRTDALKENDRIEFENGSVIGSISLKGAAIDDLTFKEYNVKLNGSNKITLLSPRNFEDGYLIESGFIQRNEQMKEIDLPDASTVWKVSGNKKLTNNNPVKLTWSNSQNITFEKHISLDDQFLFTVREKIINKSDKSYNFYSYGQIIRNKLPEISGFYILHEGFLSVLDDELIEEDYDDIQEKEFSQKAREGFVAISDKFWVTSVIPPKGKSFTLKFDYKNKFRASYVSEVIKVNPKSYFEEEIQIIVAAKRVNVIDGYAENLDINKFDLAIDWGFMYFITKPLFFVLDYFFKLLGNYGLAIIAVTVCIRLAFFPLANFSFKSMGKMKLLAPEMKRLKEVHKDKMELQKAMMALYKKEKVNPMSGCLPILVQIPVFFALYKVLFVTIEMRHMPFYGWIHDLSDRDPTSLFNVFGLIPWDPPSFLLIGAWPIIMGITMFIQQKLNPTPPDPIQAKIFMFFPIFLTVILAPFPAGLVIYWSFNNIFTMIQQYIVQRKMTIKTT